MQSLYKLKFLWEDFPLGEQKGVCKIAEHTINYLLLFLKRNKPLSREAFLLFVIDPVVCCFCNFDLNVINIVGFLLTFTIEHRKGFFGFFFFELMPAAHLKKVWTGQRKAKKVRLTLTKLYPVVSNTGYTQSI